MANRKPPKERKIYLCDGEDFVLPRSTQSLHDKNKRESRLQHPPANGQAVGESLQPPASTGHSNEPSSSSGSSYRRSSCSSSDGGSENLVLSSNSDSDEWQSSPANRRTVGERLQQSASPGHGDESSSSSRRSAYSPSWERGPEELNFSSGSDESLPDMNISDTSGSTRAEREEADEGIPSAAFLLENDSLLERCLAEFGSETLPNSTTTKAAAVAMLMSIVSANSLTWILLEQLLEFVDMLFGATAHVLPRSKYLFRKLWYSRTSAVARKYPYCESCTG